jgi:hypothetical protein
LIFIVESKNNGKGHTKRNIVKNRLYQFTFISPAGDDLINLKLYKERCWPNANNTKRFDLEKIIVDGDDAYATYNGWTNDGKLFRNTERFKFKDGKIIENECFFGTGISFPNNTKK